MGAEVAKIASTKLIPGQGPRSKSPVFVLGCGRSGTTLLYHMLLSSGDFVVYRAESNVINLLEPRFGDLSKTWNKERLLHAWYQSRLYTLTGLDREQIKAKVMAECRNGGDFLRIVMEMMGQQQGVQRWAECTPEHLLYLERIKETIPDALIIHIIRDGRDVALSLEKGGWIRPFRWHQTQRLMVAGLYWEWIVSKGRESGRKLGEDYFEVHFEDLVLEPRETLARLGNFISHDLDYDRIRRVGIGSVSEPNTSFRSHTAEAFNPVGRWRDKFPPGELRTFECVTGKTLEVLGYSTATKDWHPIETSELKSIRMLYRTCFNSKLWVKANTPLGRFLVTKNLQWV